MNMENMELTEQAYYDYDSMRIAFESGLMSEEDYIELTSDLNGPSVILEDGDGDDDLPF